MDRHGVKVATGRRPFDTGCDLGHTARLAGEQAGYRWPVLPTRELTVRRHVDLLRVSSALCPMV